MDFCFLCALQPPQAPHNANTAEAKQCKISNKQQKRLCLNIFIHRLDKLLKISTRLHGRLTFHSVNAEETNGKSCLAKLQKNLHFSN